MLLPIRTSIRPWRTPYANYAIIAINVIVFLLTYTGPTRYVVNGEFVVTALRLWADRFMLDPDHLRIQDFITYAFLHGSFMHIIGNMFFLYLFGNNVNDKLGSIGYICFYLAGAVFGGIGHALVGDAPVIGASGAVAAVTGAYLVLFPQTVITVLYWLFFFIGTLEVSAIYFIAFKMIILDNVIARITPNVAYDAHLAGYAYGILATVGLLAAGLVKTSGFDLWTMLKQWNRRRRYRDGVSTGFDPFTGQTAKPVKAEEIKSPEQKELEDKVRRLRTEIGSRITQRNLSAATQLYLELIEVDPTQVPPRQYLLDIANQLASENKHADSAEAYEKFLARYSTYEYVEQVELMLGIVYARYLKKQELAIKHLETAAKKLTDPGQIKLCKEELAKIKH